MSEFQFSCPFCKQCLDCAEEMQGIEVECPVCKNKIIPTNKNDKGAVPIVGVKDFSDSCSDSLENISELEKCDSNFVSGFPRRKFEKYIIILLMVIAFILLICSIEFGLFPKNCRKNEPQVYVSAQYSVLNSLMTLMYSFPLTADAHYSRFQIMVKAGASSVYTAVDYMRYAKQYLICEGKCFDHALKSEIINDALLARESFVLCLASYEDLLKSAALLKEESENIVVRARAECQENEQIGESTLRVKKLNLESSEEKVIEANNSVKELERALKHEKSVLELAIRDYKEVVKQYEDAKKEAKKFMERYKYSAVRREEEKNLAEIKKVVDEANSAVVLQKKQVENSEKFLEKAKTVLKNAEKARSNAEKAVKDAEKQLAETKKKSVEIINRARQNAAAKNIQQNKKMKEAKDLFEKIKKDFSVMKKKFDDAVLVINDIDEFKRKMHVKK